MPDPIPQDASPNSPYAVRVIEVTKGFGQMVELGKPNAKSINYLLTTVFGSKKIRVGEKKVFSSDHIDSTLFEDFSIDIENGTLVCLTGPSGSGKTILLKLMSGIQPIDKGRIEIHGSVVSLLNLDDNMEPNQTIGENVAKFGKLRAMSTTDIDKLCTAVIEFSELQKFDTTPIRYFSSGMQMRLSIAMTLLCGAQIMLIDDVLRVGDLAFQEKCIEQLLALKAAGTSVIMVIQDEILLARIADRVIRLNRGTIVSDDWIGLSKTPEIWDSPLDRYKWHLAASDAENDFVKVLSVVPKTVKSEGKVDLQFSFECEAKNKQQLRPLVDIRYGDVLVMRTLFNRSIGIENGLIKTMSFSLTIPISTFSSGTYFIDLGFLSEENGNSHGLKSRGMLTLEIGSSQAADENRAGVVHPDLDWTISKISEAAS